MAAEQINPYRGELRSNEPMELHTSWRAGGCAKSYYKPADKDDLGCFLKTLPSSEEVIFVGLGSNILVRDGGIDGTVIAMQGMLNEMKQLDEQTIYAEAGVTCAKLAKTAATAELSGAEFFAGIPGTVGGALAMNAGAFGSETWDFVEYVETITRLGEIKRRQASDFNIAYRHVEGLNEEWFISGQFKFLMGCEQAADSKTAIRKLLLKRNETQPTGVYSCGSVFKNPENDHAARLIEAAGMKGLREGGAHISDKHANFIINDRRASAHDIETLIETIKLTVFEKFAVKLQMEVRVLGNKVSDTV